MRRLPPPQYVEMINQSTTASDNTETVASTEPNQEGKLDEPTNESQNTSSQPARARGGGRTTVDLKPWDNESYLRIQEYFGLTNVTGDAFYIREDYTDTSKQHKESESSSGSSSKSIYYLPRVAQGIMNGDIYKRLKIVSAGIKVFERCTKGSFAGGGETGYRLLQEGIDVIAPFITKRKISVTIQDICNFIEGGLVSFSTLSRETVAQLQDISTGSLLVYYDYKPEDVIMNSLADGTSIGEAISLTSMESIKKHRIHVVCWRGINPTLNVMCSKLGNLSSSPLPPSNVVVDSDNLKHQLQALNVLR